MDFNQTARVLAILGLVFLVSAGVMFLLSRLDLPLGKLPGDILIRRGNFTCAVPLVSSLVISFLLTILLNLLISLFRK